MEDVDVMDIIYRTLEVVEVEVSHCHDDHRTG
jgi:hypothetical protein